MVPRILHPRRHRRYPAPARHSPAPLRETHRRHGRLHQRGNPSNSVRLLSGLERRGPSTAAELGAMIDIDRSVISRHASILEQAGPLARSPDERDRRWTALSLTEKVRKLSPRCVSVCHLSSTTFSTKWPEDQGSTFATMLTAFVTTRPFTK